MRIVGVSGFLRAGAWARIAHDSHCRIGAQSDCCSCRGGGRRYVDADNPVRFIDAFVDGLDLATAGFARVAAKATGRPGYAPVDLLKLYVYGYLNRVRSRRRLEREANRNIFAPRALSASRRLETSLKRLKCATKRPFLDD